LAKQFTLGKHERLKSRKLIEQLFKEGKNFAMTPFRVYYLSAESAKSSLHFGVGVGTKNFKKAVDRNKVKRLTRESYRLQKIALQEKLEIKNIQLSLFFVYTAKEIPGYKDVYKKIGAILKKINIILDAKK